VSNLPVSCQGAVHLRLIVVDEAHPIAGGIGDLFEQKYLVVKEPLGLEAAIGLRDGRRSSREGRNGPANLASLSGFGTIRSHFLAKFIGRWIESGRQNRWRTAP